MPAVDDEAEAEAAAGRARFLLAWVFGATAAEKDDGGGALC